MPNPIIAALDQIAQEKKLSSKEVLSALEKALATAYRKDFGKPHQNIIVEFDPTTAKIDVFDEKTVVEDIPEKSEKEKEKGKEKERFNPKTEIQISEAKKIKKGVKVGQVLRQKLPSPSEFGRIAAQTAKQVIIQQLRESEREKIYNNYKEKEGTVIDGVVQRKEKSIYLIDLDDALGILPKGEQIFSEKYFPGQKLKFYILTVNMGSRGPEIILSHCHPAIVKELFKLEVPEIMEGKVEIKSISRQPGERSKIALFTKDKNIDPIGAAIGQRGVRVQTIISELGGEKIDIIEYSEDPEKFIINALSPAKVKSITLKKEEKVAKVKVSPDQFSLAIGKGGQNVKLASQLTGWRIDIEKEEEGQEKEGKEEDSKKEEEKEQLEEEKKEETKEKKKEEKKEKIKEEKPKKEEPEEKEKKKEGKK